MRLMDRNKRRCWLSKRTRTEVKDRNGNGTHEYVNTWSEPVGFMAAVTLPTGSYDWSAFGGQVSENTSLILDDNSLGISDGDTVWVGSKPAIGKDGQPSMDHALEVKTVADSLSFVSVTLKSREGA